MLCPRKSPPLFSSFELVKRDAVAKIFSVFHLDVHCNNEAYQISAHSCGRSVHIHIHSKLEQNFKQFCSMNVDFFSVLKPFICRNRFY